MSQKKILLKYQFLHLGYRNLGILYCNVYIDSFIGFNWSAQTESTCIELSKEHGYQLCYSTTCCVLKNFCFTYFSILYFKIKIALKLFFAVIRVESCCNSVSGLQTEISLVSLFKNRPAASGK